VIQALVSRFANLLLARDQEKWAPVFPSDHALNPVFRSRLSLRTGAAWNDRDL